MELKKNKIILAFFVIFSMPFIITSVNNQIDISSSDLSEEIVENDNLKDVNKLYEPKSSGYWVETEDLDISYGGWYKIARDKEYCYGSGTEEDPYVIENVLFDAASIHVFWCDQYFIIRNCTFRNVDWLGDDFGAITLRYTDHGTIVNNEIYNSEEYGITLWWGSCYNTIIGNRIYDNNESGIGLFYYCDDNNIQFNYIADNDVFGIYLHAEPEVENQRNIIARNIIDGKGKQEDGIRAFANYNNSILFNVITNHTDDGIELYRFCNETTIFRNIVNNNTGDGIRIYQESANNTIRKNIIANNSNNGLYLGSTCEDNKVWQNAFVDNEIHAIDESNNGDNNWNGLLVGNYWDNYTGPDNDDNGIGDTPYTYIEGNANAEDTKPIAVDPVYHGAVIHIDDNGFGNYTWAQASLLTIWCYGDGTESNPFTIEELDIDAGGTGNCLEIGNSSVYITIENCNFLNAENGYAGLWLYNVSNANIINNNVSDCPSYGIYLGEDCENNTISGNYIHDNLNMGIRLLGSPGNECENNTISDNFIDNNGNNGIYLGYSNDNTISGNIINGTYQGAPSDSGILLFESNGNRITDNLISSNNVGLYFDSGIANNKVWKNALISNGIHAKDYNPPGDNPWNITTIGNYWDNYTEAVGAVDGDGDNIGDIPYDFIVGVAGNKDDLPIFQLLVNVTLINPINSTVFGANAPDFKVEIEFIVKALSIDKMWYSIYNGTHWSADFTFMANGTIDQNAWDELPEDIVIIRFYANDTFGNEGNRDVLITKDIPVSLVLPAADDDDDDDDEDTIRIPGYDLLILLGLIIISSGIISTILVKKGWKSKF